MSPTVKRRILVSTLVLIGGVAVLSMHGCATNDQGWETAPSHTPLPAYFLDASAAEIARLCPPPANRITNGCAVRRYDLGRCFIYVEPNVPHWLSKHELEHCAGFNHV